MNLEQYLSKFDPGLAGVVFALAESVKEIADVIKSDQGKKAGSENSFGEEQVEMDVMSDEIVMRQMEKVDVVGLVASEEREEEVKIDGGEYAVAHDPLDGSSLVDVNLAVGSIFGVYKRETFYGCKGDEQLAAVLGVYGPRTSLFVTCRDGLAYFVLDGENFVLQHDKIKINDEKKMFAPGNLRACAEREDYLELLNFWTKNKYKLRYSGGMVPDVGQILLKGGGVFTYPACSESPNGKLRLLYECAPIALLMEEAGGVAFDQNGERILEKVLENIADRTPVFLGSKKELDIVQGFLLKS